MSKETKFIKDNNLQVIGISRDRDRKSSPKFVEKHNIPFKFVTGTRELHNSLMRIEAIPLTIVFDNKGKKLDEEFGPQDKEDLILMIED